MLVDSHCHLDFPELRADLPGILSRMGDNGVSHALTISTTLETFPAVRQVAHGLPNVWCSAGVHPDERRDGRTAAGFSHAGGRAAPLPAGAPPRPWSGPGCARASA